MTVSSLGLNRTQYDCNGSTVDFPFTFGVGASSEITVTLADSNNAETVLTETTHYTVTGLNDDLTSGGTVTTVSAYDDGYTITISMNVPITQEADFTENMPSLYETFERGLDKQTRISQQLDEQLSRTPKVAVSSSIAGTDLVFPSPNSGRVIGWNAAGTNLTTFEISNGDSIAVTAVKWLSDYASLSAAISDIGATETLLLIDSNAVLTGNLTTPVTLSVKVLPGWTISGAYTLTINGYFEGSPGCFSSNLTVAYGSGSTGVQKTVAALTGLKALEITDGFKTVYMEGRTSKGDGGQGTFHWDSSIMTTEVALDGTSGVYVPPNSDTTGASGAWVRNVDDVVLPAWFGTAGNIGLTVCHAALQDWLDVAHYLGKTAYMPYTGYDYITQYPLKLYSFLHIVAEPGATIYNTYDGTYSAANTFCLWPGNYHPNFLGRIETASEFKDLDAISTVPTNSVTCTTASDTDEFAVGDLVLIKGEDATDAVLVCQMNRVAALPGSGVITLEFPINDKLIDTAGTTDATYDVTHATQIAPACYTAGGPVGDNSVPLFAIYGARIDGLSLKSKDGAPMDRGGMINCKFNFLKTSGYHGVTFTNFLTYSELTIDTQETSRKAWDVAGWSCGNKIRINNAINIRTTDEFIPGQAPGSADTSIIGVGEWFRDNTVEIGNFVSIGFTYDADNTSPLIDFYKGSRRNTFRFGNIHVQGTPQHFLRFIYSDAGVDTPPTQKASAGCRDNKLYFGTVHIRDGLYAGSRLILFLISNATAIADAEPSNLYGNAILTGNFYVGGTPTTNIIYLDGDHTHIGPIVTECPGAPAYNAISNSATSINAVIEALTPKITNNGHFAKLGPNVFLNSASPANIVPGQLGAICYNGAGGANTSLYVKESGAPSISKVLTTLTHVTTTATATLVGHGLSTGNYVWIDGAIQGDYNGSFQVTVSGDSFTYTMGADPGADATTLSSIWFTNGLAGWVAK